MWAIAVIYGAIAGLIVIGTMILGFVLGEGGGILTSQWLGYLVMLIALSLIFFGVKKYRDQELGGVIGFLPAFGTGLLIAAIAGIAYVLAWEIYLAASGHAFIADYTSAMIEQRMAEGMSGERLDEEIANLNAMAEAYANPLFRLPVTFLEIFPIGLVIALVSALLLRNPRLLPAHPALSSKGADQ